VNERKMFPNGKQKRKETNAYSFGPVSLEDPGAKIDDKKEKET